MHYYQNNIITHDKAIFSQKYVYSYCVVLELLVE